MTPDLGKRRLRPDEYEYLRKRYTDTEIMADGYELPKPANQRTVADEVIGGGLSALKGASFGLADDVVGMVSPRAQDYMNQQEAEFRSANPVASFGTEMLGGLATGGAVASGLKRVGARVLPQAAQAVTSSLRGQSAITGGVGAAGASEGDLGDRATAGAIGATGGAVLGPVFAKGIEKGAQLVNAAGRRLADSPVGTAVGKVAENLGERGQSFADRMEAIAARRQARLTPEGRANAYVARMMGKDQLTPELVGDAISLADASDPRMLFNLGGKSTQLATKVTQAIPSTATDEVPRRLLAQNQRGLDRVETALEKAVGSPLGDYQTRYGELARAATEAADPYYKPIRTRVLDVNKPLEEIGDEAIRDATVRLRDVLGRPAGRAAYEEARTNALNLGLDDPAVQAWRVEIDPQAGVGVQIPDGSRAAVTLGQMDDMKRILDDQIGDIEEAIASGAVKGEQLSRMKSRLPGLKRVRSDLVEATDVLSQGEYATARQVAAPGLQAREAFREGYQSPFGSEGNVLNSPNRASAPQAFSEGYATRLRDRARTARESQAGWADFTSQLFDSEAARNKLQTAIPDPKLGPTLQLERQLREQANNALVPRGSQTTPLGMGVADAVGGDVPQAIGGAMQMAQAPLRTGVNLGARALWERFGGGLNTAAAGDAGDLLTRSLSTTDPRLQSLLQYWLQQQADRQAAQQIGQRFGAVPAATTARRLGGR